MFRSLLILACIALATACASNEPVTASPETAPAAAASEKPPVEPSYPERAFPDDSLHDLLLAEFALRRREYDVALDTYLQQAPVLRDPAVSAQTTRLAQYMERGEDVLSSAQLWVEVEPDNLEARSTLARQLVSSGRSTEALPHLAVIERAGETANFTVIASAYDDMSTAQRRELLEDVTALATEFPQSLSLLLTQALLFNGVEQPEQALQRLQRIFALEPENTRALLLEAKILADRGADEPYARLQQVLRENPDNSTLRMRYARLLTGTDMRAAREQFEILSAQSPRDGDLLFSLALINRELGDPIAASAYLRQLLQLGQRMDEAHYYLGRIEQDRERLEDAITYYQAVEKGPEYLAAATRIGEILLDTQQLERSLAWFASQRERYPNLRERLYGMEADLLGRAGLDGPARDLLDQALSESPQDSALLYARAMLSEQAGDLVGMESDLRDILAREPDNATALNALGYTLGNRTERYEEALELVSRALELQPGEPAILDSMGWILFKMGRTDEALDYLTRAFAKFPDPEVAAHLGEVMWVLGDREGAMDVWRAASARDPDHPVLRSTLERLDIAPLEPVATEDRVAE